MNFPCQYKHDCDCVDSPVENLSAEDPDQIGYYTEYYGGQIPYLDSIWTCDTCHVLCVSYVSQEKADSCAEQMNQDCLDSCLGTERTYSSTQQTCTVECDDGTTVSWIVIAGYETASTQAEADALAYADACELAQYLCYDVPEGYVANSTQTCFTTCPDGTVKSYTVPANTFWAETQEEADADAYDLACLTVSAMCPSRDYKNMQQTCTVTCP